MPQQESRPFTAGRTSSQPDAPAAAHRARRRRVTARRGPRRLPISVDDAVDAYRAHENSADVLGVSRTVIRLRLAEAGLLEHPQAYRRTTTDQHDHDGQPDELAAVNR